MKSIHIISTFPDLFTGYLNTGIAKKSTYEKTLEIRVHNLHDWSDNNYKQVDDHPFGGGAGMVLMIGPIYKALKDIKTSLTGNTKVLLTSAKGEIFTQNTAKKFANEIDNLIIICGHFEGVDERVNQYLVDYEISVGKFILSGGEIPAMLISDAIIRLIPGVLGNEESLHEESFDDENLKELEYPHFTRPEKFINDEGDTWSVPEVLLSGHHQNIKDWRQQNKKLLN